MNNPFDHTHIQEEKAEREASRLKRRTQLIIAFFCAMLGLFMAVLYQVQIVNGESYLNSTNTHTTATQQVDSIRGEILDRYGRVLVTNEITYNVELDWEAMGSGRIDTLTRLLEISREEGVEWNDSLPISQTAPWGYTTATPLYYQNTNEEGKTTPRLTALGALAEECGWVKDAKKDTVAASGLFAAMCEDFGLIEKGETPDQADRALAGVLYELYLRVYEVSNTACVFAKEVDITFITKVKESGLDGVSIVTAADRRYETHYAAHVLGYTGAITPEASITRS